MKLLLLSKYSRKGASTRLRSFQYIPYLESKNFQVTVQSLFDNTYLKNYYKKKSRPVFNVLSCYLRRFFVLLTFYRYDIVWIEKEAFPYFFAIFERLINFSRIPYIVDYDDAIFHNYDRSNNLIVRKLLGKKIDVVMRLASCVVVGNDYLARRAGAAGARKIEIIPTVVDVNRYKSKETPNTPLTIGWIGSPTTQKYLMQINQALLSICIKYHVRLLLVGAMPDISSQFPDIDIQIKPWSEESETSLVSLMDIGIMPLPDEPWEKGKCGYKLIQYMACSIPVVASPVGVNDKIITDSGAGILAEGNEHWEFALTKLIFDPDMRGKMGKNGRIAVESRYSLDVQAKKLIAIFQQAAHQAIS